MLLEENYKKKMKKINQLVKKQEKLELLIQSLIESGQLKSKVN
jgi:hypothetical protein